MRLDDHSSIAHENSTEYWAPRVRELRAKAQASRYPEIRDTLLLLADGYERFVAPLGNGAGTKA